MPFRKRFCNAAARNAAFAPQAWSSRPWRSWNDIHTPPMPKFAKGWPEICAAALAIRKFSQRWCAPANRRVKRVRGGDESLHYSVRFARLGKSFRSTGAAGIRTRSLAAIRGGHRFDGAAGGRKTPSQTIFERVEVG